MKPQSKFTAALMVIVTMIACEPEVIEPGEKGGEISNWQKIQYNALIKSYDAEIVLKWNEALGLAIENKMPTALEARTYAMVSLAMHDALNNVIPKYETHALAISQQNVKDLNVKALTKENVYQIANAAVSQAAHDVLVTLFPVSKNSADALLATCLSEIDDSDFKTRGVAIGATAGSAMLAKRQSDPAVGFSAYSMGTAPGIHQANYLPYVVANPPVWPANAVWGANFGSYVPFGIESANQYRPVQPYAVNSPNYTTDYNEVKKLGCTTCTDRTVEQTEIGAFWKANTPGPMNAIARTLAIQEKLNGWETARLFALMQMAQIDAHIASFESKFYYNYWLPVTAVRAGDTDGNDDTQGDLNWTPSLAPPPTPDYPSTPASAGGASTEILRQFFRKDNKSFTIASPNSLPGVTRSYTSFSQASNENALSRIYVGSHFRNSVMEGEKQGVKIGKYVFKNNLRERRDLI